MTVQTPIATDEAEIRALVARCAQAFIDLDTDAVMACHTDDVTSFDCHSKFEAKGAAEMRAFLDACMPYMQGPIVHEIHDLAIAVGGDVAFSHHHARTSCRGTDGEEHAGWLRVSLGFRKVGGRWLASHAHVSAPFNPMTSATMFGLPRDADIYAEGMPCAS